VAHHHDLPIFATPLAVAYLFFTIFYEAGGPLGFLGIPFLSNRTGRSFPSHSSISGSGRRSASSCCWPRCRACPNDLVENALLDTQSRWQIFWHVSLPHLQPTIVHRTAPPFAESLKLFDIPFALTAAAQASPPSPIRSWRTAPACSLRHRLRQRDGLRPPDLVMIIITMFFRRVRNTYAWRDRDEATLDAAQQRSTA